MITVGITELHGIAREVMANPADGVRYIAAEDRPSPLTEFFIRSHAKGVLRHFDGDDCDVLEAPLFPIFTNKPWIYTPARFSGATSFNVLGVPLPRLMRTQFVKHLFMRENFVSLLFKSQAGAATLQSYAGITDERLLEKVDVVYPCMRAVDDTLIRRSTGRVNFMTSGEFFRKGGASVVDAFLELANDYPDIHLRVCAPYPFIMDNPDLSRRYKEKIDSHPRIRFGKVERKTMLNEVLPETDVFVSPTFQEAFGFAILEASAYGIPVIASRHFAIPEIIDDGVSGLLIDTDQFDFIRKGNYNVLKGIPDRFHDYLTRSVHDSMKALLDNPDMRRDLGENGMRIARQRFSFEERNRKMLPLYEKGVAIGQRKTSLSAS